MPNYAKFLKEIVANKKKLEKYAMVPLTEECNAILMNKYPPKLKDLGSFFLALLGSWKMWIPCVIWVLPST